MSKVIELPPWWGYSSEHGWVVIDRTIAPNRSDRSQHLLFFRCRDSVAYFESRSKWAAPRYIYASTYIGSLPEAESGAAAAEFSQLQARWPEFMAEIGRQYEAEQENRRLAELARVQLEAAQKKKPAKPKAKSRKAAADAGQGSPAPDA
jgi:hypothetical protein